MKRQRVNIQYRLFGWLFALRPAFKDKTDNWQWLCWCLKCLKTTVVDGTNLRSGNSRQCDQCKHKKHGHCIPKPSPTWSSWQAMRQRCTNEKTRGYRFYGAKGIKVCERWHKFENFLADLGVRPEGTTLGRLNDEGDYEPGNAFWQTAEEQAETQNRKAARAGKKA